MSAGKSPFAYKAEQETFSGSLAATQLAQKANFLYKKARSFLENRRDNEALSACDKAIDLIPNDPSSWILRCYILLNLDRCEEALTSINKAIELEPGNSQAWYWQAYTLKDLRRNEDVLTSCEQAIKMNCQISHIFVLRAIALIGLNKFDAGLSALDDAFKCITQEEISKDTAALILDYLFKNKHNPADWHIQVPNIIDIYKRHQSSGELGMGLVYTIPTLMSNMVSDFAAKSWLKVWQELAIDLQEFIIPLRLLKVSIDYKEAKGNTRERVLLQLAIEERKVLESLLGIL